MPSPFRRGTSQYADYDAYQGEVRPPQKLTYREDSNSHPICWAILPLSTLNQNVFIK